MATVRSCTATALVVAGLLLSGCGASGPPPHRTTSSARSAPVPSVEASARAGAIPPIPGGPTGPAHPDATSTGAALPVRIRIPAIGVTSALQHLGLTRDGELQTPAKWQVAGWYADGTRPGDVGPAVVAGHVDSTRGPAVFFRLRQLRPGDDVYVDRADGSTVRFRVAGSREYPKRRFPTEAVYGPVAVPTLRLVTCTGDFDASRHSYLDNLVVTAYRS